MTAPQPQLHARERTRALQVEGPKSRSTSVNVPCARGDGYILSWQTLGPAVAIASNLQPHLAHGWTNATSPFRSMKHFPQHLAFRVQHVLRLPLEQPLQIAFLRVDPDAIQDLVDHMQAHPVVTHEFDFRLLAISHPTRVVRTTTCSETLQSDTRSNLRVHISDNAETQALLAMVGRNFAVSLHDSHGESKWSLTNLSKCAVQPAHGMNPGWRPLVSQMQVDDVTFDACSYLRLLMIMKQHQWVWTHFPVVAKREDMEPLEPPPTHDEATGGLE